MMDLILWMGVKVLLIKNVMLYRLGIFMIMVRVLFIVLVLIYFMELVLFLFLELEELD